MASPAPSTPGAGTPAAPAADQCAAGNSETTDTDGDLLSDAKENRIGTSGCKADSDGDGATDGYEYRSAEDFNDDEYQQSNDILPYPGKRPYPNPLDASDVDRDLDGDGLSTKVEFNLWDTLTPKAGRSLENPLSYSAGLQYSVFRYCSANETGGFCGTGSTHQRRRVPALPAADYPQWQDFISWASGAGYAKVYLLDTVNRPDNSPCHWYDHGDCRHEYDLRDVDRSKGAPSADELNPDDLDHDGWLSDDERDEDADGLTNYAEYSGYMQREYWASCYDKEQPYPIDFAGTDPVQADSDGDTIRDGADDQDGDDIPNLMEQSRRAASHLDDRKGGVDCTPAEQLPEDSNHSAVYGRVNPFNPCLPDKRSRSCPTVVSDYAPFDDSPDWWSLN